MSGYKDSLITLSHGVKSTGSSTTTSGKNSFESVINNEKFINNNQTTSLITNSKKSKKPFIERTGDWNCFKCKNLNFSFRIVCNRCQLLKNESESQYDQYSKNIQNLIKIKNNNCQEVKINSN